MNIEALRSYLHTHIPLAAAMQVEVLQASPEFIALSAPLAPNINHRGTAFGGSIATLATLAGWSLLRVRLDEFKPLPHLVIQRSSINYLRPINDSFTAQVAYPPETDWDEFLLRLHEKGKARLPLSIEVRTGEQLAARMEGVFVALKV
ncbi:YiiD C-terminal domain-containing protein [Uliginosibacterium gangwonense]|uniref:YiiD C-terminal domain-containing protein n=1 Tax=Uliginosibacterium gangwonense TaxID=392736 RepID=UPI0003810FE7|nr:YiiD C-terminal domain-containing protein [Uliginosibacterium gangwonense]